MVGCLADHERALCGVAGGRRLPQEAQKGPPFPFDCFEPLSLTRNAATSGDERLLLTPVVDKCPARLMGTRAAKSASPDALAEPALTILRCGRNIQDLRRTAACWRDR